MASHPDGFTPRWCHTSRRDNTHAPTHRHHTARVSPPSHTRHSTPHTHRAAQACRVTHSILTTRRRSGYSQPLTPTWATGHAGSGFGWRAMCVGRCSLIAGAVRAATGIVDGRTSWCAMCAARSECDACVRACVRVCRRAWRRIESTAGGVAGVERRDPFTGLRWGLSEGWSGLRRRLRRGDGAMGRWRSGASCLRGATRRGGIAGRYLAT